MIKTFRPEADSADRDRLNFRFLVSFAIASTSILALPLASSAAATSLTSLGLIVTANGAAYAGGPDQPPCADKPTISVGGIYGFSDLIKPENTTQLRASCRTRLYLHRWVWARTSANDKKTILNTFSSNGIPTIELDLKPNAENYFQDFYTKVFLSSGIVPKEAHVNGFPHDSPILAWKKFVDEGRKVGLKTMSPVYSPNSGQFKKGKFSAPVWDNLRAAAIYGGGLSIDAPSDFFFIQNKDYQQFTIDEIRWANANHLLSAYIVSPGHSGKKFFGLTRKLISVLLQQNAIPTEFIVENYDAFPARGYPNGVGSERDPNSEAGVALWIMTHVH